MQSLKVSPVGSKDHPAAVGSAACLCFIVVGVGTFTLRSRDAMTTPFEMRNDIVINAFIEVDREWHVRGLSHMIVHIYWH